MKEIPLTQGQVALVDDEDFERLSQFKWSARKYGNTFYAGRQIRLRKDKQTVSYMHREIMNAPTGIQVDHINGDNRLNNQKENLRFCTNQQNGFNVRHPHKNKKFAVKGVSWHKRDKKFYARIQPNGKLICLGSFNVLGDADSAYRIAEEKYFGEFARKYL